jgi:DUF4097 and DUF4098 domain-containing protein YvlB
MKLKHFLGYTALITVACFLLSYVSASMAGSADDYPTSIGKAYIRIGGNGAKTTVKNFSKTLSTKDVKQVVIEVIGTDIDIASTDSDQISAELEIGATEGVDPLTIEQNEKDLVIKIKQTNTSDIGFHISLGEGSQSSGGKLKIKLPLGIKNLSIKTVNGDVHAPGLALDELKLVTVSGDSELNNAKISTLDLKSTSGSVNLKGEANKVRGQSVSGEITLNLKTLSPDIELKTTSGDVIASFPTQPNLQLNFHTVSGDVSIAKEISGTSNNSDSTEKNFSMKLGQGKGQFTVKTVSGDLSINAL